MGFAVRATIRVAMKEYETEPFPFGPPVRFSTDSEGDQVLGLLLSLWILLQNPNVQGIGSNESYVVSVMQL